MKRWLTFTTALLLALTGTAAAQTPTDYDEAGRPIRNNSQIIGSMLDVEEHGDCTVEALNNISVYGPNETLGDRGNMLLVMRGRGGEHDGDWISKPVERSEGEDLIIEFTSTGGNVAVFVLFDRHSSIDEVPITCTPPADVLTSTTVPTTTTTTVAPTTTTVPATTSTVAPETTAQPTSTTEAPATTTTAPPPDPCPPDGLACTGATSGLLAFIGLTAIGIGGFIAIATRIRGEA